MRGSLDVIRHRRRREATPIRSGSLRIVAIAAAAAFMLLIPSSGLAVHDTGAFELDGNAVAGNAPPPFGPADDWDRVCFQVTGDARCGTTTPATATAASWTADVLQGETDPFAGSLDATLFTGGGSKDERDVSLWAWKDGAGGLPDKDNLLHSFAARYSLPATDTVIHPERIARTAPAVPAFRLTRRSRATSSSSARIATTTAAMRSRGFGSSRIRSVSALRRAAAASLSMARTPMATC